MLTPFIKELLPVAAIITAIASVWITVIKTRPVHEKNKFDRELNLQEQVEKYQEKYTTALTELITLKTEVAHTKDVLTILQEYIDEMPAEAWVKDHNHQMLLINAKYTESFGITKEQGIGKSDRDMYDLEYALPIDQHDVEVLKTKKGKKYVEIVPEVFSQRGSHRHVDAYYEVMKYPVRLNGHYGTGGVVLRKLDEQEYQGLLLQQAGPAA